MNVGFTQLDQDIELANFNNTIERQKPKKKIRNKCILLVCVLVAGAVYMGVMSGYYVYYSKNLNQFVESRCYVDVANIIDLCNEQITTKKCFKGNWYVEEKHYPLLYKIQLTESKIGKKDKTSFESKQYVLNKLNKHPVGSNDTCWYHIDKGWLEWEKPNKSKFYFISLVIGGSILGVILCLMLIVLFLK